MIKFRLSKWLQLLGISFFIAGGIGLLFSDKLSVDPVITYYFVIIGTLLSLLGLGVPEEITLSSGGQT